MREMRTLASKPLYDVTGVCSLGMRHYPQPSLISLILSLCTLMPLPGGEAPCSLYSLTEGGRKGFSSVSQNVLGNGLDHMTLKQLLSWHLVHVVWLVWVAIFLSVFCHRFLLLVDFCFLILKIISYKTEID